MGKPLLTDDMIERSNRATIESIILNWIDHDFTEEPEEIARYITSVVRI
ncbi:hypothetical protein UW672_08170 [Streptococcus agalactiae]